MWPQVWHTDCSCKMNMNYEMMKALLEASREESQIQRGSKLVEFPAPDSRLDWKYLDYAGKEEWQPRQEEVAA